MCVESGDIFKSNLMTNLFLPTNCLRIVFPPLGEKSTCASDKQPRSLARVEMLETASIAPQPYRDTPTEKPEVLANHRSIPISNP